jgi:hypothetical protein
VSRALIFPESKPQPAYDDRNQRESSGNGPSEGRLKEPDRLVPGSLDAP